jgi:hypothetical protein
MPTPLPGERNPDDVLKDRLSSIFSRDIELLQAGEDKYGYSWRAKGGPGAYFTISRKIDRYERSCAQANYDLFSAVLRMPASDGDLFGKDGLMDDIGDLRRYFALVEDYFRSFRAAP